MADKIKITKNDIDAGIIEMPDGYKIEKYKTKDELDDEIKAKIKELESEKEPDDNELIDYGKIDHPYYRNLELIEQLKKELNNGI